ncbi:hypothetical protein C2G38_2228675, partial [Gigaspora rosea]
MTKLSVTLIENGILDKNLHYGAYSRYWWRLSNISKKKIYFPIRIGQKTKISLNEREFFMTVVINYSKNSFLPRFYCECGSFSSIKQDPTTAISTVYKEIFNNQTRYSGNLVLGWTNESIIEQLSLDVLFVSISLSLGEYKIFVFGVGSSSNSEWNNGGPGYKSSL